MALFSPYAYREVSARHLGLLVDNGDIGEEVDDFVHQFGTNLLMCHFSASEDNRYSDTIAVFEKLSDFADFYIEVVVPNFQTKPDLFEFATASLFLGFGKFFHLLVLVFAPIDDFYYRGGSTRGNLDEIDSVFLGLESGIAARHDAQLFAIWPNYTYFGIANFAIDARSVTYGGESFLKFDLFQGVF